METAKLKSEPVIFRRAASRAWRFQVRFAGKGMHNVYLSPDVRQKDPGWASEEFNRPIEQMKFFLPTGHSILLSGMVAYCFFIEATQNLGGRGGAKLEAVWICGLLPFPVGTLRMVEMWRIGDGRVVRQRKEFGREWGGTPIAGWKPGSIGSAPLSILMRPEA